MSAAPALQSAAPAAAVDPHEGGTELQGSVAFPPSSKQTSEESRAVSRPIMAKGQPGTSDKGKQRRRNSLDQATSTPSGAEDALQQPQQLPLPDPLEGFTYGSFGPDSGPSSSYSSSVSPGQSAFRFPPTPPAATGDGPEAGLRAGKGRQMPLPYTRRRSSYTASSHTRGLSSLGNLSDFDFFGPASAASTAPTSIHSASPSNDKTWTNASLRESIGTSFPSVPSYIPEETTESTHSTRRPLFEVSGPTAADREVLSSAHASPSIPLGHLSTFFSSGGAPAEQSIAEYQQATVPPSSGDSTANSAPGLVCSSPLADPTAGEHSDSASRNSPTLSMRNRFRRVVAARALSSRVVPHRVARTLSIPVDPPLNARGVPSGANGPGATPDARPPRRTFSRFDSAPELCRLPRGTRQNLSGTTTPSRLEQGRRVHVWAASDRISGARMGPYPSRGIEWSLMTQGTASAASSVVPSRPQTPPSDDCGSPSPTAALATPQLEGSPRAAVRAEHAGGFSERLHDPEEPSRLSRANPLVVAPADPVASSHAQPKRPALLRAALSTPPPSTALAATTHPGLQNTGPADLFNTILPRELRIEVLSMLVKLHVADHEKNVLEGRHRGTQAREYKYVGVAAAMKELVKLSLVSKTMMHLVLDGQLWRRLGFLALPDLRKQGLLRIVDAAGSFINNLDLSGLTAMQSVDLRRLTRALCTDRGIESAGSPARPAPSSTSFTALTHLNVQGLRSISTQALNELIGRSPGLRSLCIKNLIAVKPETLEILATSCHHLEELDISRCPHLDGSSLTKWIREAPSSTKLRSLRAVALKRVKPKLMRAISDKLASIQTLDLSYAASLDDGCLAALTAHEGPSSSRTTSYFELTARQSGGGDEVEYRRIFPTLRHLVISSTAISDRGLASLAYGAVPALEILEVASNERIRDRGLVALLESAPYIRRLDLEGLSHLTHNALRALIPKHTFHGGRVRRHDEANSVPTPGAHLTHLIMSKVKRVESPYVGALVKNCPRLRHLEADDTLVWDGVVYSFMKHVRNSQKEAAKSDSEAHREFLNVPAYVSMIDCNHLTTQFCNQLINSGTVRPRLGRRSFAYAGFAYGDLDSPPVGPAAAASKSLRENTREMLDDECNEERICIKAFDLWQALERKEREKRKSSVLTLSPGARTHERAVPRILGGHTSSATGNAARHASPRSRRDHRSSANAAASVARIARQVNAPRAPETPSRWMRAFLAPLSSVNDRGDDDDDEGVDALRTPCTIM